MTRTLFEPLTVATAPDSSKRHLQRVQRFLGLIPKLVAIFANSPGVLQGYVAVDGAYRAGSLTAWERRIILLAASVGNNCKYCVAAHSVIAKSELETPVEVVRNSQQ